MSLLIALFRAPAGPQAIRTASSRPETRTAVQIAKPEGSADVLFRQELELQDLRPLFLPTRFNATPPEPRVEAAKSFLDNETLKLGFAVAEVGLVEDLPPVVTLNGKPLAVPVEGRATAVDALLADGSGPATGLGRGEAKVVPLSLRGGYVEAVAMNTGQRVLAQALPLESRPPGNKPWEPMELLAVVDAAGLTAPLVVTTSSRVEEVDSYFRTFLARNFRIGARLSPGFYRIVVAP